MCAVAVPLDVEERIGHELRDLVAQLGRAHRVGEDDDVGHARGLYRRSSRRALPLARAQRGR